MNLPLKGNNIRLRALEPTDLDLLFAWENDRDIWSVSNTIAPFSKFVLTQYLENAHLDIYAVKQLRLLIEAVDAKPLGLIDLFDFDPFNLRVGLGIVVASESRGEGVAKEAIEVLLEYCFSWLNMHQVYVNIGVKNQASIQLFEKLGFELIGVKKDWQRKGDTFEDELIYQKIKKP